MRSLFGALAAGALGAVTLLASGCGTSSGETGFPNGNGSPEAGASFDATSTTTSLLPDDAASSDSASTSCSPRTCAEVGANCGPVADGCGGLLQCGSCSGGQSCGGGGKPSVCGGQGCVPKTCSDPSVAMLCGQQSDGCGGLIAAPCVTCTGTETCGGGGTPDQCGGKAGCVPITASAACGLSNGIPMNCGVVADGCGHTITCGTGSCPAGETCGGAGDPNVCGSASIHPLPDGGTITVDAGTTTTCVPIPQTTACTSGGVALCGPVSNGCGGTWTCATCSGADSCGGGGTPSVCGHPPCTPTPITTACTGAGGAALCGAVSNGCGSTWTCPTTCTGTETCGGGGTASVCGPACTPLTACPAGINCGPWPDGCGSTIPCGNCTPPAICGGGGVASQCGDSAASSGCDAGLKCDLNACDGGTLTSLSGQVFDPAGNDPLYNIVIYVPNATPSALVHGQPSCESCSSLYTGDPIVSTTTDTDGKFTLNGVPVPPSGNVPLVIQVGKWRRQMIWPAVKTCQPNAATPASAVGKLLRLPGAETTTTPTAAGATLDDLPEIAVSTGAADSMECLFQRIGFASGEYVAGWNGGSGHLHIFSGTALPASQLAAKPAATSGGAVGSAASLWNNDADLNNYDIVVLSCEGEETVKAVPGNLHDFANAGGRVFASHYHYSWLSGPLESTQTYTAPADWGTNLATWTGGANPIEDGTATNELNASIVEETADGGTPFKTWLGNVSALGTNGAPPGELYIEAPKFNAQVTAAANPISQVWIVPDVDSNYYYEPNNVDTPTVPANTTQYFSFNTPTGGTGDAGAPYCGRVVYSDLHVGSLAGDYPNATANVAPTVPGDCATGKLTPQEKALEYMLLDLASCVGSDTNLPPTTPTCIKLTACPSGYVCGSYPDGCGGSIPCGTCGTGSCVAGKCDNCTPVTACPAGVVCGEWPNGCGGSITCGTCPVTEACIAGVCSTGCTPQGCPASVTCGPTGNGCGGTIASCGTCAPGTTCGGGGTPGMCGGSDAETCVPQACPANIKCGPTGDGCGGLLDCGDCTPPQTCGGGGTPGQCGAPQCTPQTCASLKANCGQVADGCGGLTSSCGTCSGNQTCGGGGTANTCGAPQCTPSTCAALGLDCGPIGDGCGNVIQCGTCAAPDTCGGGGMANVCGSPNTPK